MYTRYRVKFSNFPHEYDRVEEVLAGSEQAAVRIAKAQIVERARKNRRDMDIKSLDRFLIQVTELGE